MLPDVEEDAGACGGEVVDVVVDDEARAVDSGCGDHVFGAVPVFGGEALIDDLVVVRGGGVVDAGVVRGHGFPWP
jgi:hypothetical protein